MIKIKILWWPGKFEIRAHQWHLQSNISLKSIKINQSFYYWKFQTKIKIMEHSIMNSHISILSINHYQHKVDLLSFLFQLLPPRSPHTHPTPTPQIILKESISSLNILTYVWYVTVIPKNINNSLISSKVLPKTQM